MMELRTQEELEASLIERLRARFQVGPEWECWEWTGTLSVYNYGVIGTRRDGRKVQFKAHRLVYELYRGPIPAGLVIDHLCRNTTCVNPSHLEPVENAENVARGISPHAVNARKTHCKRGHEFTPENTADSNGGRKCRICRNRANAARMRKYRARRRAS